MSESVHKFRHIHDELDIRISDLGCIMLDTDTVPVTEIMSKFKSSPQDDLYVSPRVEERKWINGAVGERSAHVTLLYGLMEKGLTWKRYVDELLDGIDLHDIEIDCIDYFDSPYPDDPYYCIVAKVFVTEELALAHSRLSYLPHINTFPEYNAHVTLAYIKKDVDILEQWLEGLSIGMDTYLIGREINYGGEFK